MLETTCIRTMAMTCVAAIVMLAGSPTNGFDAEGGLWEAYAMYLYLTKPDQFTGYGISYNAPSKAEAIAAAVEKCQVKEKKVPAHVRQSSNPSDDHQCDGGGRFSM